MPDDGASRLLPVLADLPGAGWRAVAADVGTTGPPADGELSRLLAAHLADDDVVDVADSPVFVRRPARLAYATAAVLAGDRAGADAFRLASSAELARTFAAAVAGDVVTVPGTASLLGSHTRVVEPPVVAPAGVGAAAHRTTFAGASSERMVGVHVDLVVLGAGPRLLLVWLADAPDPFPADDRAAVVARLAARLAA